MANTPAWFDEAYYLSSKLAQLRSKGLTQYQNIVDVKVALEAAGYTPFSHFQAMGLIERTSPNQYFNATEYLNAKAQQVNAKQGVTTWDADKIALAIYDAGMTIWEHFQKFGWKEGVNPSNAFDVNAYFESKLAAVQAKDPDGGWTLEKVKAAFEEAGLDPITHYVEYGKNEEGVTVSPAKDPVPSDDRTGGEVFTLTTGIENLIGSNGNDTFIAGAVGGTSTLNPGDQIDGGAGTDTLKLYDASNAAAFGSAVIKNVEIVENYATSDLNVSANAGVQQVWQMGNTAATTTTAALAQTVGLSGAFSDDATVTFNNATGANDSATIAVKDAAVAATKSVLVANIENLTVQAAGKNALTTLNAAAAKSLTITGEGSVSAAVAGTTTLAKIDASGNTGGVSLSVANTAVAAAGIAITGGTGNDSISLSDALDSAKKATVDLGAGNDTLTLTQGTTAIKAGSTFNGGDGTDTLVLNNTTTAIDATSGKMFTNFEHLKLTGTSTYTIGHIAGIASYEIGVAATATLKDLADGTDVLISGDVSTAAVLELKAPVAGKSVEVTLNHGGATPTDGVDITSLQTNATTLNVESTGLLNATDSNSIIIADNQGVKAVTIKGDSAFSLKTGTNAIETINGHAATAALTIDATGTTATASGNQYITTGSAADTIIVGGAANATFITAGLGADKIDLAGNTKVDTLILTSQADSTAAAFDQVKGFEVGASKDVIDISAFNISNTALHGVATSVKATVTDYTGAAGSSSFSVSEANAASFFTNAGVQTAVVAVTDGNDSFVFIDADGNGAWNADTDSVILLAGVDGAALVAGNFLFA